MSRIINIVLAVNLTVIAILTFIYPHLMVGPGKLIPGHRQLELDCFACHAPLFGATSERCISCHKSADVGRLTTTRQPILKPLSPVPFHQKLISQDCVACHSDHADVQRFRRQGLFKHALLQKATRDQCQACHKLPADSLHKPITGNCSQCHTQEKWVPAIYDHGEYYELDRDSHHKTRCVTCHANNDFRRYTCYGCHEHTPDNIRLEHLEENIRHYESCIDCH